MGLGQNLSLASAKAGAENNYSNFIFEACPIYMLRVKIGKRNLGIFANLAAYTHRREVEAKRTTKKRHSRGKKRLCFPVYLEPHLLPDERVNHLVLPRYLALNLLSVAH